MHGQLLVDSNGMAMTAIKKILVIRFRRVGDAVLTMALCSSLRRTFPDAEIDYVLNEGIDSLFEGHADIDKIISFSHKQAGNIFLFAQKVWRLMRTEKYDVLIDARSTTKTLLFSLFSLQTPYRIGTKKSYNYFLHNYRIENRSDKKADVIKHLLMLLDPLKTITPINFHHDFTVHVTDEEKNNFLNYMIALGINPQKPTIMVAASARLAHKIWSMSKMKAILHKMIEYYDAQIILNVTGAEAKIAMQLHKDMKFSTNVFTTIEAKSLRELSAMIANCDFFFGNEGGPRHIAQALSIPSYAIFPPTIPKSMWLPNEGERYAGISPDDILPQEKQKSLTYKECFDLIEVDRVWRELDTMLARYLPSIKNKSIGN